MQNEQIVLSIVTTLPVPNIVRWIIEHFHLQFRSEEAEPEKEKDELQDQLL